MGNKDGRVDNPGDDDNKTLIDTAALSESDDSAPTSVSVGGDAGGSPDDDEATRALEVPAPATPEAASKPEEPEPEKTVLLQAPIFPEEPPAPRPQARLIVQFGNDRGREFPLSDRSVAVGRSLDADIVLNDPSVSRRHFEIHYRDARWVLKDLGSVNGTRVGGQRIQGEIVLEEGAQIEAGQTLLAFTGDAEKTRALEVPEVAKDEAATVIAESPPIEPIRIQPPARIEVSEQAPAAERRRFPVAAVVGGVIGLAVVTVLVAQFGFGVRILPLGGEPAVQGPSPEEVAAAARAKEEAKQQVAKGLEAVQARDWDAAVAAFERALELDAGADQVAQSLDRAREERRHAQALAAGRSLLAEGKVQESVGAFGRIPDTSVYYAEAREAIATARDRMVVLVIEKVRALLKERKKDEAKAAYVALLEEQPQDERVLALRKELEAAGIRLEPRPPTTTVVATARPQGPARPRAGRIDIREALDLYDRGAFAQAVGKLRDGAAGAPKAEAAQAQGLASRIERFAQAFREGRDALAANRLDEADRGLNLALRLDHEVNDHYQGEIRGLLGQTYRRRAAVAIQNTDYLLAAKSAKRALMYNPQDRTAQEVLDKCVSKASRTLDEARADLQAGRKAEARDKLSRVIEMVPPDHELAAKARDLMDQTR